MAFNAHGIGTEFIRFSKIRSLQSRNQYDAIEGFIIFHLLIFPFRAVHLLSEWNDGSGMGSKFELIRLKLSFKHATLAYLRSWGHWFTWVGSGFFLFVLLVVTTMTRPWQLGDEIALITSISLAIIGPILLLTHKYLSREREFAKDIIGLTDFGHCDPKDFDAETKSRIINDITTSSIKSIENEIRSLIKNGELSKGLFLLRLAHSEFNNAYYNETSEEIYRIWNSRIEHRPNQTLHQSP